MERERTARFKSKKFALRIIRLYQHLCSKHREYDLFKQLLRSGTSIGANLAEAECAISRKDFLAKAYIALNEFPETCDCLELLYEAQYLTKEEFDSIFTDCEELKKMLSSTTKTINAQLQRRE